MVNSTTEMEVDEAQAAEESPSTTTTTNTTTETKSTSPKGKSKVDLPTTTLSSGVTTGFGGGVGGSKDSIQGMEVEYTTSIPAVLGTVQPATKERMDLDYTSQFNTRSSGKTMLGQDETTDQIMADDDGTRMQPFNGGPTITRTNLVAVPPPVSRVEDTMMIDSLSFPRPELQQVVSRQIPAVFPPATASSASPLVVPASRAPAKSVTVDGAGILGLLAAAQAVTDDQDVPGLSVKREKRRNRVAVVVSDDDEDTADEADNTITPLGAQAALLDEDEPPPTPIDAETARRIAARPKKDVLSRKQVRARGKAANEKRDAGESAS